MGTVSEELAPDSAYRSINQRPLSIRQQLKPRHIPASGIIPETVVKQALVASPGEDGQACSSAHACGMRPFGVGVVDFPLGPAFEDLFDGHPTFRPGQRRAEAEVQALPEAEVASLTVD